MKLIGLDLLKKEDTTNSNYIISQPPNKATRIDSNY